MQFKNFLVSAYYTLFFRKIVQCSVINYEEPFPLTVRFRLQLQFLKSPFAVYSSSLDENTGHHQSTEHRTPLEYRTPDTAKVQNTGSLSERSGFIYGRRGGKIPDIFCGAPQFFQTNFGAVRQITPLQFFLHPIQFTIHHHHITGSHKYAAIRNTRKQKYNFRTTYQSTADLPNGKLKREKIQFFISAVCTNKYKRIKFINTSENICKINF